jgi:cysteine desulfurase
MGRMHYLDNNATTAVDPEVYNAMLPYFMEKYANASGVYSFAQEAKKDLEDARAVVAKFLNADPGEIVFNSGGTESDNTAIKGTAFANRDKGNHIITSSIEHHAVLNTCKYLEKHGFEVTYLPVDRYGLVDPAEFKRAIKKETILASIMFANNEVGTIEPIKELAAAAKEAKIIFHTDAVQAAGKMPIDVRDLGVDLLSLSAHKFYGPKGVGLLYIKKGTRIHALLQGGHHEKNRRAGTENIAGIVGMAKAAGLAALGLEDREGKKKIKALRDMLEKGITEKIPEVQVNGHPELRMDNTLNVCIKYIEGESMLIHMDFEGICASSGSACTSGSLEPSHVLLAMGIPHEIAHGSIRFSFSKFNTEEDVNKVLEVLPPVAEKLRNMSPLWKERVK